MLYFVIFLIFSIGCASYASAEGPILSCQGGSVKRPPCGKEFYQNLTQQNSFLSFLEKESFKKIEALKKNPAFQEIVKDLQKNTSLSHHTDTSSSSETQGHFNRSSLYIFVSFSMGEKALLNIAHEAKRFGATLVLRGFREGSYLKTAQSLQSIIIKTGQGVIIDPELYSLFDIKAVPTFVLTKPFNLNTMERAQTPIHDKLQGYVNAHYVLETFAKEGDLKQEAQQLLHRGVTP